MVINNGVDSVDSVDIARALENLDIKRVELLAVNFKCNGGMPRLALALNADILIATAKDIKMFDMYIRLVAACRVANRDYTNSSSTDRIETIMNIVDDFSINGSI